MVHIISVSPQKGSNSQISNDALFLSASASHIHTNAIVY
ncbi:hypothetical protein THOG11_170087 [Vibrio harveyi]|nr:hypothetical protein TH15OA1_350087 [Vibrio harveyi]CAH1536857.1 hypothetical protein VHARVF571_410082 [Vibrio harveyi]CAH1552761.1 hypothetical protein THOD03_170087 [Vibrio harveyi]CAH1559108.1 hypothetical protein THOG11_170087 [Vibrio harveyi]